MNIYEQLLSVCEQLLKHSALPEDMLAKYYLLKQKKLSQMKASQILDSIEKQPKVESPIKAINSDLIRLQSENDRLKNLLKQEEDLKFNYINKLQQQYEDQLDKAKIQYKKQIETMQRNYEDMLREASNKIDKYEVELEENNVFFSSFVEQIIPFLELHEQDFTSYQTRQHKQQNLSEKQILLDFVVYMISKPVQVTIENKPTQVTIENKPFQKPTLSSDSKQQFSSSKKDMKPSTTNESHDHELVQTKLKEAISSPHFQESRLSQKQDRSAVKESLSKDHPKQYNLDSLYLELKGELELSKQTLLEFERSRQNLQSTLRESGPLRSLQQNEKF